MIEYFTGERSPLVSFKYHLYELIILPSIRPIGIAQGYPKVKFLEL